MKVLQGLSNFHRLPIFFSSFVIIWLIPEKLLGVADPNVQRKKSRIQEDQPRFIKIKVGTPLRGGLTM